MSSLNFVSFRVAGVYSVLVIITISRKTISSLSDEDFSLTHSVLVDRILVIISSSDSKAITEGIVRVSERSFSYQVANG